MDTASLKVVSDPVHSIMEKIIILSPGTVLVVVKYNQENVPVPVPGIMTHFCISMDPVLTLDAIEF